MTANVWTAKPWRPERGAAPADPPFALDRPSALAARYRHLALSRTEVLAIVAYDAAGTVLAEHCLPGTEHSVAATPAEVLRGALWVRARALALVHNHPSGNPIPSSADLRFTRTMRSACRILQLVLVDHVIVASRGWLSLRDSGCLELRERGYLDLRDSGCLDLQNRGRFGGDP